MAAEKTAEKAAEPPAGAFNLDGILKELGSFGKYQLLLLLLLAFRDSFLAMCNFHYVFTAADVAHRCHIPECEALTALGYSDTEPWGSFALPNDTHSCLRHAHTTLNQTRDPRDPSDPSDIGGPRSPRDRCRPEYFLEEEVHCDKVVYENYNSIVAEFDLGCAPWKRTMIGTVHNLGLLVSFVVSGFISDRYGRKVIIVGSPLVVGAAGLLKSFARSYWALLVLEFLETALGYGNASLVLSLETVNQSSRVTFSCISDILSSFGSSLFGVIAWKVPYWRHLVRAIYAPLLVAVFYIFLVDEGVRWLLAHNKKGEAVRVLHKVARVNKVTLSSGARDMLQQLEDEISRKGEQNTSHPQKTISSVMLNDLRNRTILARVALIGCCFFCCAFVYTAATINSTGVSGDPYLNFAAMSLVTVPIRVLTAVTLARFGRKAPICAAYLLCAVFSVMSALVPRSYGWASLLLYLAAKMGNSYGYFAVYLVAMELFPTTSRNSLLNIATTFGRVGSVLAPQTPLLEKYMRGLPSVVLGVAALGPALLALLLPDTSRSALPEDARAAERLDAAPAAPAAPGDRLGQANPGYAEQEECPGTDSCPEQRCPGHESSGQKCLSQEQKETV